MKIKWFIASLATSFFWNPVLQAQQRPIVAVFDIDAQRAKLDQGLVDSLSDFVRTSVGLGKMYQVVPPNYIQQALKEKKKDSYKTCFDQQCQIELGQELAANKTLSTRILRIGSICTVTMELYDLKQMTSDATATAEGECGDEKLMDSVKKALTTLKGVESGGQPGLGAVAEKKKTGPDAFLGVWDFLHSGNSFRWVTYGGRVDDFVYTEKWVEFKKNQSGEFEFQQKESYLQNGTYCEKPIPGEEKLVKGCGYGCAYISKISKVRYVEAMNAMEVDYEIKVRCQDGSGGLRKESMSFAMTSDGKKLVYISYEDIVKKNYSRSYIEQKPKLHIVGELPEFTYAMKKE